jgi:bifunctional UDP-N-acetylglucosamine pyrophosphorylase/glucosamine-1-phosphate N-acetyltransferase
VVVLAAGEGTRMKSALPKVLHRILGRTLLGHVLAASAELDPQDVVVVVGHGRDAVTEYLSEHHPAVRSVVQGQQRGTGHAVGVALEALAGTLDGPVVVLAGDAPLITGDTLRALLDDHAASGAAATVLSARVDDPTGYGRVVRASNGSVTGVVEQKDADATQLAITEINSGAYAFAPAPLREALALVGTDNAAGEQYLTDVLALLNRRGLVVGAVAAATAAEVLGVNDRAQLATARALLRDRVVEHWMREGVTVVDPRTTWIGVHATLEADAVIHQNTQLHGRTTVARYASVGPDCTLRDVVVEEAARVRRTEATGARIGAGADVGPFSYLRPGTVLEAGTKVGAYVEVKNSTVGEGSKVPHLSYVGDADIGSRSNIGAASVFVNYDGVAKHRTVVGDAVRVGSDTMIVAPVTIGDGAYTAAGSVVTDDVPPGALAIGRARQRNVEGWVERRRGGSPAAAAAAAAARTGSGADQAAGTDRPRESDA